MPVLRDLTPMRRGFWEAVQLIAFLSVAVWFFLRWAAPKPSPEFLRSLAAIGGTLLIAYVVETSWIVKASRARDLDERESRLGTLVGFGAAGLVGIALALAISERASVHHWIWLDEIAFAWAVASLGMFGITVVLQPLLIHEWMDDEKQDEKQVAEAEPM